MDYQDIFTKLPSRDGAVPPCFAFSVHKCGSTMMHAMIGAVCQRAGVPAASIPDMMFANGILDTDWAEDPEVLPAFRRNLLYFGFRHLPSILLSPELQLRSRRFVLLVRDPRDALVSQYFSYGKKSGSHAIPKQNAEAFLKKMGDAGDSAIDDYAISAARNLKTKLEAYRDNLDFNLGLLRRYEDVYFDKETFLAEIFDHFGIAVPRDIIAEVARANDVRPEKEDDSKHIRKGTPGDHAEKLHPDTIARLNDTFREVGAFYGYTL